MEIARWLVVFVAFITGLGGLFADYIIPASAAQHFKNPRWPPHAKFHNAQGILLGVVLGNCHTQDGEALWHHRRADVEDFTLCKEHPSTRS
jgi:hypothetical protein